MSASRLLIEKEIDKVSMLIEKSQNELRELQYELDQKNKVLQKWQNDRQELLNTLNTLNGE